MTLQINATVQTVETNSDGDSVVWLNAFNTVEGQTVTRSYKNSDGQDTEYTQPQIISNTEGKVLHASITLVVEGSEPPLAVGDILSFSSHFDSKATTKPLHS